MQILDFQTWLRVALKGERIIVDCPLCDGSDYYCLCCNGSGKRDVTYIVYIQDAERNEKLLERWRASSQAEALT